MRVHHGNLRKKPLLGDYLLIFVCRCVVWTGDGRVFFYNPSTRTSVWERPEDLLGRADVDKAISTTPEQLLNVVQPKDDKEKPKSEPTPETPKKRTESESSGDADATANKKPKLDTSLSMDNFIINFGFYLIVSTKF